jgi:dephospho-CoA kinase
MGTAVVGVTGGIGSGKTAATDHFASLGITVVDADLASRVIMEPGRPALAAVAERFGTDMLLDDGNLDRGRMRELVFRDPSQRQWLEQLTHPLIAEEIFAQLQAATSAFVILSSPLLLETAQKDLCDCVVVVDVPESVQLERTMTRDENDEAQVRRIIAAQMPRQQRLALADHVLDNSGSLQELQSAVDALHGDLLTRFAP